MLWCKFTQRHTSWWLQRSALVIAPIPSAELCIDTAALYQSERAIGIVDIGGMLCLGASREPAVRKGPE